MPEGESLLEEQGGASTGKPRRFRLNDARGVRREIAALYTGLRNGTIDPNTVRTGSFVLRCLLEAIRTDEFEQQLLSLEQDKQAKGRR